MADISVEQKQGGGMAWIWAALAILSVAGLMFWLASQDVETGPVAVEEEGGAEVAEGGAAAAETVELPAVAAAPGTFIGRSVAMNDVAVAASLGARAFWADVPGANPFLVVLAPEVANPEAIESGQPLDVTGTVNEVTPAVVQEWVQAGAIRPGEQAAAEFATHYILANRVAP